MQFGNQNVLQLIGNITIFEGTCYPADRNWYEGRKKNTPFHKKAQGIFLRLTKLSTFLCYLYIDALT